MAFTDTLKKIHDTIDVIAANKAKVTAEIGRAKGLWDSNDTQTIAEAISKNVDIQGSTWFLKTPVGNIGLGKKKPDPVPEEQTNYGPFILLASMGIAVVLYKVIMNDDKKIGGIK